MDLTHQTPADGICKMSENMYHVKCHCGYPDHDLTVYLESEQDEYGTAVTIYATTSTAFWSRVWDITYNEPWPLLRLKYFVNDWVNRLKLVKHALFTGYVTTEVSAMLTAQQAVNLAAVLSQADAQGKCHTK